ncbi:DNA methylase N-4/N-6 domain protein [Elusimicrobium minutum Pei191]|uniref:Methyltransferase n=1 Tax=Elusimicrobium minutum (strain Pei191) TaxID=445932 RepID=B2KCJ5_ELUMP|nr:site-specific DNA-methyltransferase [Elusimicrobium minutum]ACC98241.1 DNA methylase N-4/N-6 domain protein [Elusimicrobium minutum Pei191]
MHFKKFFYEKDNFKLILGNSIDVIKSFPDESCDMIFADPPYMLSNGGFTVQSGKRASVNKGSWDKSNGFDSDFEFHNNWIKECKRILKKNGTIWISGTYHSIYQCGFALQKNNYHILNDIAWFKPNAAPNLSCRFFTASHETLIWARKNKIGKHTFNYDKVKNGIWSEDFLKKPNLQMRSVWAINTPKKSEKVFGKHPTQKPFDLMRRIILSSTKENDLILDPFTGSSTTGLAATYYKRNFIGIDIEQKYLELSKKRYEQLRSMKK